jgi:hypothetical protein
MQVVVVLLAMVGLHRSAFAQVPAVCPAGMLQLCPVGQAPASGPQFAVPPQPSGAVPQVFVPQAAVLGVHTHLLLVQTEPLGQAPPIVPHVSVPVQPSESVPQLSPAGHDVCGVQTHLLPVQVVFGGVVH